MTPEITQLILDALRSLLNGNPDAHEQARVKVEQAQQLLLGGRQESPVVGPTTEGAHR
jgi:hypothetical protein